MVIIKDGKIDNKSGEYGKYVELQDRVDKMFDKVDIEQDKKISTLQKELSKLTKWKASAEKMFKDNNKNIISLTLANDNILKQLLDIEKKIEEIINTPSSI